MKVLVAYGSKHGATKEIAEAIGLVLREQGHDTQVQNAEDVIGVAQYEAFVVGSAVYAGQWRRSARQFVEENAASLSSHPTWFFSSGPIGTPLRPDDDIAVDTDPVMELVPNAREHHLFSGKIDKSKLNFGERAIVMTMRGIEGDYRDWKGIEAWATDIANDLKQ